MSKICQITGKKATTFRTQKEERKEDLMSTSLQRNFIG
mgnify:CR=1 FL=1